MNSTLHQGFLNIASVFLYKLKEANKVDCINWDEFKEAFSNTYFSETKQGKTVTNQISQSRRCKLTTNRKTN